MLNKSTGSERRIEMIVLDPQPVHDFDACFRGLVNNIHDIRAISKK